MFVSGGFLASTDLPMTTPHRRGKWNFSFNLQANCLNRTVLQSLLCIYRRTLFQSGGPIRRSWSRRKISELFRFVTEFQLRPLSCRSSVPGGRKNPGTDTKCCCYHMTFKFPLYATFYPVAVNASSIYHLPSFNNTTISIFALHTLTTSIMCKCPRTSLQNSKLTCA